MKKLANDLRGSIAVTFALMAPMLLVSVGLAIDFSMAATDKTTLNSAADSAVLAAITAAKNYYAANSSSMSDAALVSNAEAAGKAAGIGMFTGNSQSIQLIQSVVPTITMTYSNLTFTADATWAGEVATHILPLIGVNEIGIGGTATATGSLPKFIDFYWVVDTSGSMGIPADSNNQQLLREVNPDNPIMAADGYSGGCQFACHFQGYQGYNYAETHDIPLKLDSISQSFQSFFATANTNKVINNQYRVGIYPFIDDLIQAAPLSSNFSEANAVAVNLGSYLDNGGTNQGMGSGGTHFEKIAADFKPYMGVAGTGLSASSPQPFMILITDGVDNAQVQSGGNWTGSQPQTATTTICAQAKAAGYTVAVVLIPYAPIVDPQPIWNNEDGIVNQLINTDQIKPVMTACASGGYFFEADTSADITAAMQTIFYQATGMVNLTK